MNESLLRAFISEAVLAELRRDEKFIAMLRNSGVGAGESRPEQVNSRHIATEWIEDLELEVGKPISHGHKAQVFRFVIKRMPGLVARYRGNIQAARQTMYNLLDTKFNELRMGD